jgi:hypothetical protein
VRHLIYGKAVAHLSPSISAIVVLGWRSLIIHTPEEETEVQSGWVACSRSCVT